MFKSYVISLATSARRRGVVDTFAEADLTFEFINASDPAAVQGLSERQRSHYFDDAFYSRNSNLGKWATLGCALSHALLWEKLDRELTEQDEAVLIFEDDTVLERYFKFNLTRMLADGGPNLGGFDIIFFPGWELDERYTIAQMASHRYLARMTNFTLTSTAGYLVRPSALKKLIGTVLPFANEVDVYMAFLRDKLTIGLAPMWPHLFKAQVAPSERLRMDRAEADNLNSQCILQSND